MRIFDRLQMREWRHFELLDPGAGGGSGDGGGDGSFPYGPGDRNTEQNPGPPPRGSYSGGGGGGGGGGYVPPPPPPKPPPDIFAGFIGPAVDAAKQMAQQFMALMGYPSGLDANQLTLQLLHAGVETNQQQAMDLLFYSGQGVSDDMRNTHQWAQFGLDALTWQGRVDGISTIFQSLTAGDPRQLIDPSRLPPPNPTDMVSALGRGPGLGPRISPLGQGPMNDPLGPPGTQDPAEQQALRQLYYTALKNNWSQAQIMQQLQTGSQFASLREAQPWLVQGQGEQQASNLFSSIYGSAPVDTGILASWFRFNTETASFNRAGREAIESAAPQTSGTTTR